MEHKQILANGIKLHVVQDGPRTGRLVILLHGFPEFWYGWRRQIPFLAAAGYRVWAPDQRGYNLSGKPGGMAAYSLDALGADVIRLLDAAGQDTALLVGHDDLGCPRRVFRTGAGPAKHRPLRCGASRLFRRGNVLGPA